MNFVLHPDAESEFREAIDFYEGRQEGLGGESSFEVRAAIRRIVEHPAAWPVLEEEVRRSLVHRFSYGVLYSIEPDRIFILSAMHLRRDPEYWKKR